jgi:hypothetical protein
VDLSFASICREQHSLLSISPIAIGRAFPDKLPFVSADLSMEIIDNVFKC